ncbi:MULTISPECIES: response regulator transcription factor [unclassified Oceanobacter]|jgi:DNA-binding NarL/FixJ family response regulator|uniref:response regulator n=1 Tax=unclassified Oceanobacter TaxID=2620260 RepID=UPI00273499EC|nr:MULTISPECIES: response regulator transcription factor [unclassified Oceanobacter]MDP2505850.1 response regulator transcription factor [Oceanobacter sp. 3_MG-2023]MDP2548410.1 response regulator transcription factor [Oceanobacter sp. 4_MG-2023]MDP2610541.1 response regulator transcription factor [Oceanobacter sp. 1_MG-2023]MDP2613798.1 response regulator transcription factor [Oceanobacter sp. 2_MG-2023]
MYQVLIADDHPLFRRALSDALDETGIACSSSECEDFYQVLQTAGQQAIDLLLLDLRMPGNTGLMGLMRLRAEFPQLAIVIVSASEDRMVIEQVRQLGALGYIQKSSTIAGISQALAQVMEGKLSFPEFTGQPQDDTTARLSQMTPQQLRVLQLIAEGALNKQIGYTLNIKETTVKSHISDIFRKLNINNRTQAALIVQQLEIPD